MIRLLAAIVAPILMALTVSPSLASEAAPLRFTIERQGSPDRVKVRFERDRNGRSEQNWDSSFKASDLTGLDLAALNGPTLRPIHFSIAREAGRIDCGGTAVHMMARGTCSVTPDADFVALLNREGIGRPNEDQTLGLIALDVRRSLVVTLAAAHFPKPSVGQLMELTAVGATPDYIRGLGATGYRPQSIEGLVQFAALKITPEFIGGFERLGYHDLPTETLVQLKALNVTPEFARSVRQGDALPSPERLVRLRVLGRD